MGWVLGNQWNCGHTNFLPPHQLTLDLGQVAKLNRFKLYQRGGSELYKHGNPKRFEIYGRLNLDNLPIYDPDDPGDGWIFLGYFESFKPSGLLQDQIQQKIMSFKITEKILFFLILGSTT